MSERNEYDVISDHELKKLLHPKEDSRFLLALLIAFPATILVIVLIFASMGKVLLILGVILASVWSVVQVMKAALIGGAVRVSLDNFPEIYEILLEVKRRLNYEKSVEIYVIEDGSVNALLYKFFQTKFIVLNSAMVAGMSLPQCRGQLVWIIGRFIGALKAKHLRFDLLSIVVNSVEQIKVFNLLILPYERATQYSGDQIGLALSNDLSGSIEAFDKLLIGKDLAKEVRLKGLLTQAHELQSSVFGWVSRILSSHPHMTDRYLNLIAFAKYKYPNEFQKYIEKHDNITLSELEAVLPKCFSINKLA